MAARPRTLGAGLVPVAVGVAVAGRAGKIDAAVAAATACTATLLQVAANLANDYYDFAHGVDTAERLGPVRVAQAGLLDPESVKRAVWRVLGGAVVLGVYLVAAGGWPIAAIGAAAMLGAIAYSAGPRLAWRGLGDVMAFVFFGPVAVAGTVWLQRGAIEPAMLWASMPVACLVTAIMVVNNLRDIPTDRASGKTTLAVRLGPLGTRLEYTALVALAFASLAPVIQQVSRGALLGLLALPLALHEVRAVWRRDGAALNRSLAGTARLHAVAGALLAAGVLL